MDALSLKKLTKKYKELKKNNPEFFIKKIINYNYLNLSIHFSRDSREFDNINYQLLKYSRNLLLKSYKLYNKKVLKKILISYFNSFKEYKYLFSVKLPLVILKDIFVYGKQTIDLIFVFSITLITILINFVKGFGKDKNFLRNKKIYSLYYWNKKGDASSDYYYPNFKAEMNSEGFIISFVNSRFFSFSYLHSIINSAYLSPANTLSLKGLILSVLQFIHLFVYDFYLSFSKSQNNFLKFWVGWKRSTEIFYSFLIYNSLKELALNSYNCKFIAWYENQIMLRSFSLAISNSKRNIQNKCKLHTYNGTPFTLNNKSQYLPTKAEMNIGFWGSKYYLQDQESFIEMKNYIKKNNISLTLYVVPKSMVRIDNSSNNNLNLISSKEITIFTHDSNWDLIACLISLFNKTNFKTLKKNHLIKKIKEINIRLHPSLNKIKIKSDLESLQIIPQNINYKFIENRKESILDTMKSSKLLIFGESSYSNLALKLNHEVVVVHTSHIKKPPIRKNLILRSNLTFLNPW